jgi:hypothetical protein
MSRQGNYYAIYLVADQAQDVGDDAEICTIIEESEFRNSFQDYLQKDNILVSTKAKTTIRRKYLIVAVGKTLVCRASSSVGS